MSVAKVVIASFLACSVVTVHGARTSPILDDDDPEHGVEREPGRHDAHVREDEPVISHPWNFDRKYRVRQSHGHGTRDMITGSPHSLGLGPQMSPGRTSHRVGGHTAHEDASLSLRRSFASKSEDTEGPTDNSAWSEEDSFTDDLTRGGSFNQSDFHDRAPAECNDKAAVDRDVCRDSWVRHLSEHEVPRRLFQEACSRKGTLALACTMPWSDAKDVRSSWSDVQRRIHEAWAVGYTLRGMQWAGSNNTWVAVMAKGTGVTDGVYTSHVDLDAFKESVECQWAANRRILDITGYADGKWLAVFGKSEELDGDQAFHFASTFHEAQEFIKSRGRTGFSITSIAKSANTFLVVMTLDPFLGKQVLVWTDTPTQSLVEHALKGYTPTSVVDNRDAGHGPRYLLVLSEVQGSRLFPQNGSLCMTKSFQE